MMITITVITILLLLLRLLILLLLLPPPPPPPRPPPLLLLLLLLPMLVIMMSMTMIIATSMTTITLQDLGCDIHTHAPAQKGSRDIILYPSVLRACSTNPLGHGHGYECHGPRSSRPQEAGGLRFDSGWLLDG